MWTARGDVEGIDVGDGGEDGDVVLLFAGAKTAFESEEVNVFHDEKTDAVVAAVGEGEGVFYRDGLSWHEYGELSVFAAARTLFREVVFEKNPGDGPAAFVVDGHFDLDGVALSDDLLAEFTRAVEPGEPCDGGEVCERDEEEECVDRVGDVGAMHEECHEEGEGCDYEPGGVFHSYESKRKV